MSTKKQSSVLFISKEGISTFWFLLAAGTVLGTFYYLYGLVDKKGLRPQFIIMTNPDVQKASPEQDALTESAAVLDQTRLAMDSIFNKNSNGLDAQDRCRKILAPDVFDWVQSELVEKQTEAFKEARFHQKIEIENIDLTSQPGGEAILASVRGQLLRVGILDEKVVNDVWSVRAELVWVHNVNLRNSGRHPLICTAFNCRETPVSSTIRRSKPAVAALEPSEEIAPADRVESETNP